MCVSHILDKSEQNNDVIDQLELVGCMLEGNTSQKYQNVMLLRTSGGREIEMRFDITEEYNTFFNALNIAISNAVGDINRSQFLEMKRKESPRRSMMGQLFKRRSVHTTGRASKTSLRDSNTSRDSASSRRSEGSWRVSINNFKSTDGSEEHDTTMNLEDIPDSMNTPHSSGSLKALTEE